MTRVIESVFLVIFCGHFMAGATELPPEIMADRYLVRAERLMEEKDYEAALDMMGKIVALQKEHDLTLPDEFHFKYAQVAFSAGLIKDAVESLNKYLSLAGKAGAFYREALELLDEAQPMVDTRQTCAGQPKGATCWKELSNRSQCYVWRDYFLPGETVTWSGECYGGVAIGKGTLKWVWSSRESYLAAAFSPNYSSWSEDRKEGTWNLRLTDRTGHLQSGGRHGHWVTRWANGRVEEGPYAKGKRHGHWVFRYKSSIRSFPRIGSRVLDYENGYVEEGPYVEDKQHGHWVFRYRRVYHLGNEETLTEEGPYVEGKLQGKWVTRGKDGRVVSEGPYVDGERYGFWVEPGSGYVTYLGSHDGSRSVLKGTYVKGEKHGDWVVYSYFGNKEKRGGGPYVNDKKDGDWVEYNSKGKKRRYTYQNGKRVDN